MKPQYLFTIIIVLSLMFAGCAVKQIETGEAGVKAMFGKIQEEPLGTGWHFYIPLFSWIEGWNVKTQELKETASVPSSEGLISTLDVSVLYNIPVDQVVFVRQTTGSNYQQTILEPYSREAIRNVVSGYAVKSLYSEQGRKEISENILEFLKSKLEPRGVAVQDVLLRDVKLPPTFSLSIEAKLRAEQEALQKEFELQKAKKDAEIEVARAEGVAKSNVIIANSITDQYLRYQWIQTLKGNNLQVVYVPTEANIPIMEAMRMPIAEATQHAKASQ